MQECHAARAAFAPDSSAMVRLYLIRHAVADEPIEGLRFAEPLRSLTAKGRRRFRRSAKTFAALGEEVDAIFSSPILRAVQTAELLSAALQEDEVHVLDELRPDAAVAPLIARLAGMQPLAVALVGHKRLLCELAAALAGVPLEEAARIRLKRGAIARIDVHKLRADGLGKPRWWLAPAAASVQEGLPLDGAVSG